jgi:hypothetical protein
MQKAGYFIYIAVFLNRMFGAGFTAGAAEPDSLVPALHLNLSALYATTDPLGNVYVITPELSIEKYAPDGRLLTRYTQNRYGMPAYLDVTNPLKVLVWYADFRTVVWLDRSLTDLGELNLIDAGYPEVRNVGAAQDGNLWIYDEAGFRLRKISADGRPLFESQDLNLIFGETLQISCIREYETGVLAAETRQGALQFDSYGQYVRTTMLTGTAQFLIKGREAYFIRENELCTYSLSPVPAPTKCLLLPKDATRAWLGAGTVIVAKNRGLEIWKDRQ